MQAFNPYLPSYEYVPDGEPHVFGDRVYIYGSHDAFDGDDFCMNDYVCWSASVKDLSDWRYEGVIYQKNQDPRNADGKMRMCAPDVAKGPDGRYYLYYQLHELQCTCVAVCDTPGGKFSFLGCVKHPDGTPWGEKSGDSFAFDPGILVDEDGRPYLYVGHSPAPGLYKTILKLRKNRVEESVCLHLEGDMMTVIGDEHPIVPGPKLAEGTEYEGHGFFEASSIRKVNGKYYYVYSSVKGHELCYAVSDYPDREFKYGGTLVSIGDVGIGGRKEAEAVNSLGNTHGGMECIDGQWYIFYHRHTNKQKCARQGCAEKLTMNPDGSINQAELTSCGLNKGVLQGTGRYEARIACQLYTKEGVLNCDKNHVKDKKSLYPFFTQTGSDRENHPDQYIANMKDGATAGFKYFHLESETKVAVCVKGEGKGRIDVSLTSGGKVVLSIPVEQKNEYHEFSSENVIIEEGVYALFFTYHGSGYVDFNSFTLS